MINQKLVQQDLSRKGQVRGDVRFAIHRSDFDYLEEKYGSPKRNAVESAIKKMYLLSRQAQKEWGVTTGRIYSIKDVLKHELPKGTPLDPKLEKQCDEIIKRLKYAYDILSGLHQWFYIDESK